MSSAVMLALPVLALAQTNHAPKMAEAVLLRNRVIGAFCNATNAGLFPGAAGRIPCQVHEYRTSLYSKPMDKKAREDAVMRKISSFPKETIAADRKLTYQSVCSSTSRFSEKKMCRSAAVCKFFLGGTAKWTPPTCPNPSSSLAASAFAGGKRMIKGAWSRAAGWVTGVRGKAKPASQPAAAATAGMPTKPSPPTKKVKKHMPGPATAPQPTVAPGAPAQKPKKRKPAAKAATAPAPAPGPIEATGDAPSQPLKKPLKKKRKPTSPVEA